jgi:16S rRNA (adenine1518-N6/adenine1519-N6)-dimethyltransferase
MPQNILDQVKQICKSYNIQPERNKGQNFLINPQIIKDITLAAEIKPTDTVLEIGPGLGILTEELVKQAKKVVSIELDDKLFDFLRVKFVDEKNLELINNDILKIPAESPRLKADKIVANLPYNITSYFLKKFLTSEQRPQDMTLLLQKEVAKRICALPGQMSLLAVSVQLYGSPKIIKTVEANNFWPRPAVDSAILKIENIKTQGQILEFLEGIEEKFFWQVVKIGFSAKRKQLQHNISAGLKIPAENIKKWLVEANFDPKIRAQNLSVSDWLKLCHRLAKEIDLFHN